jgi:hypothetical protein
MGGDARGYMAWSERIRIMCRYSNAEQVGLLLALLFSRAGMDSPASVCSMKRFYVLGRYLAELQTISARTMAGKGKDT